MNKVGICKKVTFVIGYLRYSGAERVLLSLANCFADRGIDVSIVLLSGDLNDKTYNDRVDERISIYHVHANGNIVSRKIRRLLNIRKVVKGIAPDAVVSFNTSLNILVIMALFSAGIPIIVSERNDPKYEPKVKWERFLRRLLYRLSDGFVFQTPDASSYFSKTIQNRGIVIPNPIAADSIPKPFTGWRNKDIVTVGRLEDNQKNHTMLIHAFALISETFPECRLIIYGEGDSRKKLECEIRRLKLNDRVILHGFEPKVHNIIKDSAMFVMPSNYEGMPNALIEAMALGMPVISTDCPCGGPRYLIKNGENGLLVPVGNTEAMAEAIRYLLINPDECKEMGENAARSAEMLLPGKIAGEWHGYIASVIAS